MGIYWLEICSHMGYSQSGESDRMGLKLCLDLSSVSFTCSAAPDRDERVVVILHAD